MLPVTSKADTFIICVLFDCFGQKLRWNLALAIRFNQGTLFWLSLGFYVAFNCGLKDENVHSRPQQLS